MKLYNRGSRVINPNTPIAIHPGKWSPELDDAQAQKLLKMFPRDLTSSEGDVAKINSRLAELEAENAQLKNQNKTLRDQVANFEQLVASASQAPELTPAPIAEDIPVNVTHAVPVATPAKKGKK